MAIYSNRSVPLGAALILACIGGVIVALIFVCMLGYEFCVKSCINRCKKQSSEDDNNHDEQTRQQQVRNSSVFLYTRY